jgi:type I restriction enzyme M protein
LEDEIPGAAHTAIIIFAKGGKTENVFFYDVESDGFTLDDKRTKIGDGKGDLPDVQTKYLQWCDGKGNFSDRTAKAFEVPVDGIREQGYDLSVNRYKKQIHAEKTHADPRSILKLLQDVEGEILKDLAELEELLG